MGYGPRVEGRLQGSGLGGWLKSEPASHTPHSGGSYLRAGSSSPVRVVRIRACGYSSTQVWPSCPFVMMEGWMGQIAVCGIVSWHMGSQQHMMEE